MDMTPNMAEDLETLIPPTAQVSMVAGQAMPINEIWSEAYAISFTQGDLPIVWPHFHYFEMSLLDENLLFDALRDSVTVVAVGQAV